MVAGKFTYGSVTFSDPTPRWRHGQDRHPITGDVIVRQDALGYRAARIEIARTRPNHPVLQELAAAETEASRKEELS